MKEKKIPMRRCAGCNESKPKGELIRISAYEGAINIDESGKAKGRGVYLCRDVGCVEKARKKKAISRSLGIDISPKDMSKLFEELKGYEREN